MKSVELQMARVTCVLGVIASVLLFRLSLSSQPNFGRFLGIVMDRIGGVLSRTTVTITVTIKDKDRAVDLLAPPEEETWECVVSS